MYPTMYPKIVVLSSSPQIHFRPSQCGVVPFPTTSQSSPSSSDFPTLPNLVLCCSLSFLLLHLLHILFNPLLCHQMRLGAFVNPTQRATWRNGSALDFDFSFQQDKTSRGCRFESCSGRFPRVWFAFFFLPPHHCGGVEQWESRCCVRGF
jgi:hypothetical protein